MTHSTPLPAFGKPMRKEFLFADTYLPLNHGSYGTYPRSVHEAKLKWQELAEQRPDLFMRKTYMHQLNKCRGIVAKAINADVSDCVFVMNATSGVNEILNSLEWKRDDTILCYSTAYGACEKVIQYQCDINEGIQLLKIDLDYPVSDYEILQKTEAMLKSQKGIKLLLMDAISSLPGVRFPWERVCKLCRQYGVYSLVDGAHAVTQVSVDIAQAQPDFFVSNLHKWSYVPRGCAVLYVRKDLQHLVHCFPIGHGYVSSTMSSVPTPITINPEGQWVTEHEWPGTIDFSGWLSVEAAFQFIHDCGGAEKIREYCHGLAVDGGNLAAEIFGTEVLECEDAQLTANMVNVKLPLEVPDASSSTHLEELAVQRDFFLDALFERDAFPYPYILTRAGKKEWWCRFSAQIYLDREDFEKGAQLLKEICDKLGRMDFKKIVQEQDDETIVEEIKNMVVDSEART